VECLASADDLARWAALAGLHDGSAVADAGQLAAALALREHIDRALVALAEGRTPHASDLRAIDRRLARSAPRPRLLVAGGDPELTQAGPADPIECALGLLALDAARIVGTGARERVRICAASDCSARFVDRSPSGRRRWCSMAACGNRAKARRHRDRRAATAPG
jgi:predicted RNA-binding Zn ribbon-like protein